MNGKDFAIGVLSVTAVILLTGLILVQTFSPQSAMAFAQSDRAGDYVVATAQLDDTVELLNILDAPAQRMNVYILNGQTNQIELIQVLDVSGDRNRGR
jgi:hypothetical protein